MIFIIPSFSNTSHPERYNALKNAKKNKINTKFLAYIKKK